VHVASRFRRRRACRPIATSMAARSQPDAIDLRGFRSKEQ